MEYKSTRKESYMDLQLDVKGCKNVYDSFVKYTEVEKLDGQNQYKAEGHGLQVVLLQLTVPSSTCCFVAVQIVNACSCMDHQAMAHQALPSTVSLPWFLFAWGLYVLLQCF